MILRATILIVLIGTFSMSACSKERIPRQEVEVPSKVARAALFVAPDGLEYAATPKATEHGFIHLDITLINRGKTSVVPKHWTLPGRGGTHKYLIYKDGQLTDIGIMGHLLSLGHHILDELRPGASTSPRLVTLNEFCDPPHWPRISPGSYGVMGQLSVDLAVDSAGSPLQVAPDGYHESFETVVLPLRLIRFEATRTNSTSNQSFADAVTVVSQSADERIKAEAEVFGVIDPAQAFDCLVCWGNKEAAKIIRVMDPAKGQRIIEVATKTEQAERMDDIVGLLTEAERERLGLFKQKP